jgi:Carboxypeptidase regulatory-like domain/TonB-dependent Receptor Plug Domain
VRYGLVRVVLAVAVLALGGFQSQLHAQGLTGQITGIIADSGGGVMPGATVTLKNAGTNQVRETTTGADGTFTFPDLLAGTYDITVAMQGFKTYEQKGIVLGATERVALRQIALEVGQLQETVTVTSEAALVQTTTAARSAVVDRQQIEDIALKGRDFAGYLKLLPGVIDTSAREAPGWGSMGGLSINGRGGGFNFSYDGVTNKDTGSNSGNYAAPALDSIAEVRVQTSNFQAEYGRSSGATITVVTRSGTKDFHGSAAFYKRDDAWNGNEFSRRQQCSQGVANQCDPPLYTFDNTAWTLGGPVLLPGTNFNRARNKLFFFWSQDILSRTDPGGLNQRRVPTALERQGNFSQTFDSQNRPILIRDPQLSGTCNSQTGGTACFSNNIIPADRINKTAQALLNLFPLPNATDPTGANLYNYTFQTVQDWPRNDQVLRMDYNIAPNTTMYGRLQYGYEKRSGGVSFLGASGGWPQMATKYEIDTLSYVNTLLHTFSNNTFFEFTVGVNWSHQYTNPIDQSQLDANDRTKVLPGFPQFFPAANPLNLLPQASFTGGLPTANTGNPTYASFGYEQRFGFYGFNAPFNISSNLTKVKGAHNMKAGIFLERTTRPAQRSSAFNGTVSFNTDGSNPLNTNVGFANALLGAITQYQESESHPSAHGLFYNTEWYVQDNWRLKRNLTLDVGMRFYYITPTQSHGDKVAQWEPDKWIASKAPLLYTPVTTPQGRRAQDPLTGQVYPLVYLGRLVPNSGDFINGMIVYDNTTQQSNPFRFAPRIGFAWDVTGDGRTSVRAGAGTFYDRYQDDNILDLVELPPLLNTYTTNYTTIPELLASPLTATTTSVRFIDPFDPPTVHNWSAGVQRDIGWSLVGDFAYVGNAARKQRVDRDVNGRPYGYAYQPSSLDPTNVVGGVVQPLPDDLLRPYRGYARIQRREFSGYSDYHSVQGSVNKRRGREGLSFSVAYTYQIVNNSLQAIDPFVDDNRARNYTQQGRRPHTLTIGYAYDVPALSHVWSNPVVKAVFDDWQVSGITSVLSGTYGGFSYSYSNVPTGTLTGTGAINGGASRVVLTCDPNLPGSERTFQRQFRTECVQAPTDPNRLGTSTNDEYLGPGFSNWDISFFKNVPMGGSRRLQFRFELYNAFNQDEWTGVNTAAQFNYVTGQLSNQNVFGSLNGSTQSARRIQLGVRFTF